MSYKLKILGQLIRLSSSDFDQSKTRANQRQEKSAGACEGSGQEIVSHKSSYVFWSGLIFLFFYITHNDYSFILIMRMIHDTINQKIRHLITHRLI